MGRHKALWAALLAGPLFWWLLSFFIPLARPFDGPLGAPLLYLQLAFIYPVLEEIVFRGAIQPALHRRLNRRRWGALSGANLVTSLLFSLMHGVFRSAPAALLVFAPSLLFGYFRDRYDGVAIPIVLHCYYNAGFYWLFWG